MFSSNLKSVASPVPEIMAIEVSYLSSIFMRFRNIAAFVLHHTPFLHPTLVFPKFPHVFLGLGR